MSKKPDKSTRDDAKRRELGAYAQGLRESRMAKGKLEENLDIDRKTLRAWETGNPESNPSYYDLYRWARALAPTDDAVLRKMLELYDPKFDFAKYWDAFVNAKSFVALDENWLKDQPADKRLGLYAGALRQSKKIARDKVENDVGLMPRGLNRWERGETTPSLPDLYRWGEALHATNNQRKRMLQLHSPEININKYWEPFLDTKGLLALDDIWLDTTQEPIARVGMYADACRNYAKLTLPEMAAKANISRSLYETLEYARQPVADHTLENVATAFKQVAGPVFKQNRFVELYHLAMPLLEFKEAQRNDKVKTVTAEELQKSRVELGKFAKQLRDGRPVTELAARLRINEGTYYLWEKGHFAAKPSTHDVYRWGKQLHANLANRRRMLELYDPAFDMKWYWKAFDQNKGLMVLDDEWRNKKIRPAERFGAYVAACREYADMTVDSFAERAGIGAGTVSDIENAKGSFSSDIAARVAKAIETTPSKVIFNRARYNELYHLSMPLIQWETSKHRKANTKAIVPEDIQIQGTVERPPDHARGKGPNP